MTDRLIDAAGKCDRCLGHKASLGLLINEKDQWANCPVGITATTLSCVYCRWDDAVLNIGLVQCRGRGLKGGLMQCIRPH